LAGNVHLGNTSGPDRPTALDHLLDTGDSPTISGRLETAPSYNGLRSKLLFQADQLWLPQGTINPINEQILLTMPFVAPDHLEPGQRLLVRATLSRPQPPGTPGSFDYRQYLADRGIHITGYLRSPACLAALHLSTDGDNWTTTLRYWPQKARQKVNRFIARAPLPPPAIGLYQALVTGELALVPQKTLADFRSSGAFHLLSISGTHLALLGLLCGLTLNLLLRRSRRLLLNCSVGKISAALTILVLLLYSLLAGMNPPVVRSLIMAVCLIGGLLINRSHFLPNSLGLALLLSLLWHPADLFHASFQLSYAAITGIVILHAAVGNRLRADAQAGPTKRFAHWLLAGLAVSLAALLATAPITQYHFRQVALLSPLSTLLLAPLLCFWSLPLGLLASLLSSWFPTAATSLLELGGLGLALADGLNTWLAGLSSHTWQPPIMPLAAIPFYYLGLAALLLSRRSLTARTVSAVSLTVLLVIMLTPPMASSNSGETRVTFLDVGQGSATLLELPGGRNILIDCGSSGSDDYDVGAEVIAPFFHHLGLRALEAVVITHDHGDHHNGLATILDQFPPTTIWTNERNA
ncbi:MAG TPA: ComEC/Rec2 family competence protein, partial [Desulfurivibrionaceae bacterium]|nr:ComEC/Rec2 family competence protein [Desulfurivibrionaceae bacterium]